MVCYLGLCHYFEVRNVVCYAVCREVMNRCISIPFTEDLLVDSCKNSAVRAVSLARELRTNCPNCKGRRVVSVLIKCQCFREPIYEVIALSIGLVSSSDIILHTVTPYKGQL